MNNLKKALLFVLAAIMLFGLVGCQSGLTTTSSAEVEALQQQLTQTQQQLTEAQNALSAALAVTPAPVVDETPAAPTEYAICLGCTFDGYDGTAVILDGTNTQLTARATLTDGMVVDYWTVNGFAYPEEKGETMLVTADTTVVVQPVLRQIKKITSINAEMQFLNSKNKPSGKEFKEFVFDADYENPATKTTVPGGTISVYVEAVVPRNSEIDHWKINGVPMYHSRTVTSITLLNVSETTVIEVVMEGDDDDDDDDDKKKTSTPKPSTSPSVSPSVSPTPNPDGETPDSEIFTPTPTKSPSPSTSPTNDPSGSGTTTEKKKYTVTLSGCTSSDNTSSVEEGKTITVTPTGTATHGYWVVDGADTGSKVAAGSKTFTVNGDMSITWVPDTSGNSGGTPGGDE